MQKNKYKIRFWIEWGGEFLWPNPSDEITMEKFEGCPIRPENLNVSKELCEELNKLAEEYQTSLNWSNPTSPSPWSEEQFKLFFNKLRNAYQKLCEELKDDYEITYGMDEHQR